MTTMKKAEQLVQELDASLGLGLDARDQAAMANRIATEFDTGATVGNRDVVAWLNRYSVIYRDADGTGQTDILDDVNQLITVEPELFEPGDSSNIGIDVDIDTAAFPIQTVFDADGDAYNFIDDAAISNYAVIDNFSVDDTISFVNAVVSDYTFSNDGEDVILSYNYNDERPMNVIKLAGVVTGDDLVYDQASLVAAIGFDVFG